MSGVTYEILRAHLVAEHGYTDAYFDEDYPVGGPITDLSTLRWLHAPWRSEKGHRDADIVAAHSAALADAPSVPHGPETAVPDDVT